MQYKTLDMPAHLGYMLKANTSWFIVVYGWLHLLHDYSPWFMSTIAIGHPIQTIWHWQPSSGETLTRLAALNQIQEVRWFCLCYCIVLLHCQFEFQLRPCMTAPMSYEGDTDSPMQRAPRCACGHWAVHSSPPHEPLCQSGPSDLSSHPSDFWHVDVYPQSLSAGPCLPHSTLFTMYFCWVPLPLLQVSFGGV